ncbi:hypothetical protein SESBI_31134 [Sesbania bispinosa]|nr:hypothetical protein SESBI_31134 [Sesbania bispinosa]
MDVEKAAPQSTEGTSSGSQRKGLRVKSPTRRVKSSGVSSINDSVGKQIEEKQCDVGLVKRTLRVKSPTKKSPAKKSSTEAAVGQSCCGPKSGPKSPPTVPEPTILPPVVQPNADALELMYFGSYETS